MKKNLVIIFLFLTTVGVCQDIQQNDFFLAQTYFRQGEYEKSAQLFEKLYNKSPFNTTYLQKLITCYQETNNFLKAENLLKTKLSKNKSQIYLYVLLGYNYERQELKEIAKNNYEKVINSLDNNAAYAGIIGRLFKDYNLLDYAITTYKKGMEKNPKSNYNFQIAQIYGEKGDFKQMFEYYINLIDKNVSYLNLIQRYAGRYITDDPENETNVLFRKTLLRKAASNPKDEWNILLSWLFTQQKDYSKALTQEKALYQRKPENLTEIFKLGKIAFDDKNFEAAIECFNFIDQKTTLREEKIEANLYLAKIKVTNKEEDVELFFRMLLRILVKIQKQ
jgi:tetratricopeptide (TPR) repeat protein